MRIGPGSVGPEVRDVQERLTALHGAAPQGDDPGIFGDGTAAAVRVFQQQRGLVADGIVGHDTWSALVEAGWRLGDRLLFLTRPMLRGDDVRDLQERLNRLGFDTGYTDGIYGPLTFDAVREFQLNTGLVVDGIAGSATVDALRRLHLDHQESPAFVVRERESLRRERRLSVAGARVMFDPGHGPDDPGSRTPDGAIAEHELTWQLTNRLAGRFQALGGIAVLSRGPNTTPTPADRAALANREEVDAIVSVHLNALDDAQARGAAAYHFGSDRYVSERGRALAELCVDHVVAATGTAHCRTHPSTTSILRESRAPAVVVEPGFLTHPEEGPALTDPDYQSLVAGALLDAVVVWLCGTDEPT
ncbi:MAG: N-acetylmuramoyl-L-alanine amidase [Actinomycetes bacterium]